MTDKKNLIVAGAALAAGAFAIGIFLGSAPQAEEPTEAEAMAQMDAARETERDFLDFTAPDLSTRSEGQRVTRHGCVLPARPEWAEDAAPGDAHRVLLLQNFYNLGRYQDIVATQTCPCEIEHPSWQSADALYQRLAVDMDAAEISTLRQALQEEIGRVQKKSLDICRAWRAR
ncbi:hypothetical protein [Paracoccus aestuarii]|uniref:hypothetical protein n=1 Tax=Paracoccus aestuarii TaxID=453842 RepID=UPI001473D923|nr:hypothetical protein [Paracoccus aestuarii]